MVDSWKHGVADPPLGDVVVLPDNNVAEPEQLGKSLLDAVTWLPDLLNVKDCPNTMEEAVVAVLDDNANENEIGLE